MRELLSSAYECRRCGTKTEHLKPEYLPIIKARLGDSLIIRCQICHYEILAKKAKAEKPEQAA